MKASEFQGHCQACGRIQVVVSGAIGQVMSNHGYKVRSGYFRGVCIGHDYPALEVSRERLNYVVAYLGREAVMHQMKAERLISGADLPAKVMQRSEPYGSIMYHSRYHEDPKMRGTAMMTDWHNGSKMEQDYQLKMDIGHHQSEASTARRHAAGLLDLATRVHGRPLINRVAVEQAAKKERAKKRAPIAGAFRTKAAQKEALDSLNRAYEKLARVIKDHYLNQRHSASEDVGSELYWQIPHSLHQFRPKHADLVRKIYPAFEATVVEIERLVIFRNELKAMPVIK